MYSFAICLWELYTHKIPYRDLDLSPSKVVYEVVKNNLRPHIPVTCPDRWATLLEACWAFRYISISIYVYMYIALRRVIRAIRVIKVVSL